MAAQCPSSSAQSAPPGWPPRSSDLFDISPESSDDQASSGATITNRCSPCRCGMWSRH
jgi:hypothetical protein